MNTRMFNPQSYLKFNNEHTQLSIDLVFCIREEFNGNYKMDNSKAFEAGVKGTAFAIIKKIPIIVALAHETYRYRPSQILYKLDRLGYANERDKAIGELLSKASD